MTQALVQSGTEAALENLQEALACLGKIVRLHDFLGNLYVAVYEDEDIGHRQMTIYDDHNKLYGQLRTGAKLIGVEVFANPLPDESSACAEDCYVGLRFVTPSSVFWSFPAWQFDLTEE